MKDINYAQLKFWIQDTGTLYNTEKLESVWHTYHMARGDTLYSPEIRVGKTDEEIYLNAYDAETDDTDHFATVSHEGTEILDEDMFKKFQTICDLD